jgi:hypothetical protein
METLAAKTLALEQKVKKMYRDIALNPEAE